MPRESFRTTFNLSRRTALGGVGAAAAAFSLGHLDPATAQEATPSTLASHPIIGAWLIMNPSNPPSPSLAVFAADGTVTIADVPSTVDPELGVVFFSPAVGVWEPTGERSAHVTFVQVRSTGDGTYLGTLTVNAYPKVNAEGQSWADAGTRVHITLRDASDAIVVEAGGSEGEAPITPPVHAVRMQVGNPGFPEGTPTAGTPTG